MLPFAQRAGVLCPHDWDLEPLGIVAVLHVMLVFQRLYYTMQELCDLITSDVSYLLNYSYHIIPLKIDSDTDGEHTKCAPSVAISAQFGTGGCTKDPTKGEHEERNSVNENANVLSQRICGHLAAPPPPFLHDI